MGIYYFGEILKRYRESLGMTQEMLSEGICSPQTVSRIENGRQKPGRAISRQMMERLGKEKGRGYAIVPMGDAQVQEEIQRYEDLMEKGEYKAADRIIRKLEGVFGDTPAHRQYILGGKAHIGWKLRQITGEEGRAMLWEALGLSVPNPMQQELSRYPWIGHELLLLYGIADSYYDEAQTQEAVSTLEGIYEGIWSGYRMPQMDQKIEFMILQKLMDIYGELGQYRRAIEYAKKGIETCQQEKSSLYLVQFLEGNAQNIKRLLKQGESDDYSEEIYKDKLIQAIAIASALGKKKAAKRMKRRYHKYFDNRP